MKRYKVTEGRKSEFENPVVVKAGEKVTIMDRSNPDGDWAGWILCKTTDNEGWIPFQIVDEREGYALITEDYSAVEFDLEKGEILVEEKELNGWIWCHKEGMPKVMAWAPLNCIEELRRD